MKNMFFCMDGENILKSIKYFSRIFIIFLLSSSYGFASNYPLKVIQPQENLDIENRFYKAYPELEYNVRMAVIGGEFPYSYALTNAPSGLEIDPRSGEISWPSPTESETPYSVTATVTDAENRSKSVSWTILVTKEGFIFVDAVNGTASNQGGKGTIDDPWLSLKDVYGGDSYAAKHAEHHKGEFVYWRAGTYEMDGYISDDGGDGLQLTISSDNKPQVWLGYPGGSMPVISQRDAHLYFEGKGRDVYLDGLDIRSDGNHRGMGIKIASIKENVVLRRNKFSGIRGGSEGGNNALVFINLWGLGTHYAIQDNEFSDVDTGYGILNYNTKFVLVEDNTFQGIGDHGVGMKVRAERWSVRSNRFRNNARFSINSYNASHDGKPGGDVEISYNVVEAGGGEVVSNSKFESNQLPVHIFRNTFMDGARQYAVFSKNGPYFWKQNVIISDSSKPDNIDLTSVNFPERLIMEDNLSGGLASGIVNAKGNLTAAYAEFIGKRGHQLGNPPVATSLTILDN